MTQTSWVPGGSQLLGCRAVEVSYTQVGYLDTLRAGDTFVRLSGWTFDPDAAEPNHVVVIADGALLMDVAAIRSRPDVGAAYPGAGPERGFAVDVTLSPGSHSVCAYATCTVTVIESVVSESAAQPATRSAVGKRAAMSRDP